ncbi:MAG TPA: hypothetical protein VE553_08690 [Candidatus Binatia bacterium]|nr:hypothetical protein [Candidatus Binatia bacterium]
MNAYIEVGSISLKTHAIARVDVEARIEDVEVRVWQEDGCVFIREQKARAGQGMAQPKADILVTLPPECATLVQVVTGAVAVHNLAAAVQTHVITGKTTLSNLQGPIVATSVTGSINYGGTLVDDMHRFMTTTGSIHLALQEPPNARIYAWATTGHVQCDLALTQKRRGGYLTGDHLYGVSGNGEGRILAEVTTGLVRLGAAA